MMMMMVLLGMLAYRPITVAEDGVFSDDVDFGSNNFEAQLASRIQREEDEMRQAAMNREKQRDLDRDRKNKERDEGRRERESGEQCSLSIQWSLLIRWRSAEMLDARREMIQKQEEEDAKRREEADAASRNARWAEGDIKIKSNSDARMARLEEIEKSECSVDIYLVFAL